MSIFLVNLSQRSLESNRYLHENLGLLYIKSYAEKAGILCHYIDNVFDNMDESSIIQKILEDNPLLLGVSLSVQAMFPQVATFVKKVRAFGYQNHITVGGVFASIESVRILNELWEVDSVQKGEGEEMMVELYQHLKDGKSLEDIEGLTFRKNNRIIESRQLRYKEELDSLPYPDRQGIEMLINAGKRVGILASRGCISNCVFCSSQSLKCSGMPRRQRLAKNVVSEMIYLYEKYGVTRFKFNDPVFVLQGEFGIRWIQEFCRLIKEYKKCRFDYVVNLRSLECLDDSLMAQLAESGLTKVVLGVESGSDKILNWMKKPTTVERNNQAIDCLKRNNIQVEVCFIFFVPIMDLSDIALNIAFLKQHNALTPFALISEMEVYNGSIAENLLEKDHKLHRDNWWQVGKFKYYNDGMLRFMDLIKPILNEFQNLIRLLHVCDIEVMKKKKEVDSKALSDELRLIVYKSGEVLSNIYLTVIDLIESKSAEAVSFANKMKSIYIESRREINRMIKEIYRFIYSNGMTVQKNVHEWLLPEKITIEASKYCNLHCIKCPNGLNHDIGQKGFLDKERFRDMLDSIPDFRGSILLSNWGDAFLNPDIFDIIKIAKEHSIRVTISSNLNYDYADFAEKIVRSEVDKITVGIDGATQASYGAYRRGGNLELVLNNIDMINQYKQMLGVRKPELVWQTILNIYNENEIDILMSMAKERNMSFKLKPLNENNTDSSVVSIKPSKEMFDKYCSYFEGKHKAPGGVYRCDEIWNRIVIGWNGDVYPCCSASLHSYKIGNVFEMGLKQIWNSEEYNEIRRMHLQEGYHPKHKNCCVDCKVKRYG